MSGPSEAAVSVNGEPCRVWRKGDGAPLGVLAGFGGNPAWTPFLERLAGAREVVVPSLPGYPGGLGHKHLDSQLDWIAATLDLLEGAGLAGADLVGHGPGAALAAEVAAMARPMVARLVLMAPVGLFDEEAPMADVWAVRGSEIAGLMSARASAFAATLACPEGGDETEWKLTQVRAAEAAARMLWPNGDLGLEKRLGRIEANTLLLWGAEDRVVSPTHAERYAAAIGAKTQIRVIEGAGHRLDFDAPDATAEAILAFLK